MELMLLNGTHRQMNILLATILLMTFLRRSNAKFLCRELGLPVLPDCPLIMLGSGNPLYEDWMRATESIYRDKFRGWVAFNIPVSHRITADCGILLLPSAFEPCGLNQLYGMRYGTIPVVHETGGLRDTVQNFNPFAGGGKGDCTVWTFSPLTKEHVSGTEIRHSNIQRTQIFRGGFDDKRNNEGLHIGQSCYSV